MIESESDFFVIHAKWSTEDPDGTPRFERASESIRHRMLWERFSDRELARQKRWRRRGFFGHTPVMNYSKMDENLPIVANGAVLLDTGAALGVTGRLTAFCADDDEYIQVDREGSRIF